MTIFRSFRRLIEAIEFLGGGVDRLARVQEELGPALDRIDALELSRHQFEAECEGKLLQADGKLKAAANAEARERQLKKSYERIVDERDPGLDSGGEGGPQYEADSALDAQAREEERLQALRLVVAPNNKAAAIAAKWS